MGGFWVRKPTLQADEVARWQTAANRTQGNRSVGGRLFLTNQRVLFEPNRVDSITGGQRWSVDLTEVHEVGVEKRGMNPVSGALRKRLRLKCTGTTELFVVNHVDEVIDVLKTALSV